jgi:cell wall-associated NlpC family hydrolase
MREKIISVAHEYLGTPYRHQGRLKYVGVDCIGLVMCVAEEVGLLRFTSEERKRLSRYDRLPRSSTTEPLLHQYLDPVPFGEEKPGDIPWMAWRGRRGMHAGILIWPSKTAPRIIHVDSNAGETVVNNIPARGIPRVLWYFKFKGVDE